MAINFNNDRNNLLNINRDIDSNQMSFLPNFLTDLFSGNPEDIQIGEEGSAIDKAKDALEKNKQKELPSVEDVLKGDISSLGLPSDNLTAMKIANFDEMFSGGQKTMKDFAVPGYENLDYSGFKRPDIDTEPFSVNEVLPNEGITKNVRYRDMILNDLRNLKDNLSQKKDTFTEGLASIKDKGFNLLDFVKGGGTMGLIGKNIFGAPDPRGNFLREYYGGEDGSNVQDGMIQSGLMRGYAPVSGGIFGSNRTYGLQNAYDKRINTIMKTLARKYGDPNYRGTDTKLDERLAKLREEKRREAEALNRFVQKQAEKGADRGVGPGGSGSRRGAADIPDRNRGSYATDDTASFF